MAEVTFNPDLFAPPDPPTKDNSSFLKGFFIDAPLDVGKSLLTTAANSLQVRNPTNISVPGSTIPIPTSFHERAYQELNNVLMGLPDIWNARYKQYFEEHGSPENIEDAAIGALQATTKTGLMDVLPGNELKQIFTGTNASGQSMSSSDYGKATAIGALKAWPAAKGIGKVATRIRGPFGAKLGQLSTLDAVDKQFMKTVISEGELNAPSIRQVLDAIDKDPSLAPILSKGIRNSETLRDVVAENIRMARELGDSEAASRLGKLETVPTGDPVLLNKIFTTVIADEGFYKYLGEVEKITDPAVRRSTTQHVGKFLKDFTPEGQTTPESVGQLLMDVSKKFNIPIEKAQGDLANVLMNSTGLAGETLQTASSAVHASIGRLMIQATKGGPEGMAALKKIKLMEKINKTPPSDWSKAVSMMNNDIEGFRRAMMVGQLSTAMRNLYAQGVTGVVQLAEDTVSGLVNTAVGKMTGKATPLGAHFADLLGDFNVLASTFNPAERKGFTSLLNSLPFVKDKLYNTTSMEIGTTMLYDVLKNKGDLSMMEALKQSSMLKSMSEHPVKTMFGNAAQIINSVNYLQETNLRRLFFMARLEGNIRRRGMSSFHDVIDIIKSDPKGVGAELKIDIANALEHALKQTYSHTPEAGLGKVILDTYKRIPFSTAILPPFPRFLMNQYRWQMERAPSLWFNLFEKGFRDKLFAGAEGGFASTEASRVLGRATGGLMLMNAAWALRNSETAGPKYYLFKSGLPNTAPGADEQYVDIRPYQPFASFAFIADQLKHFKSGTKPTVTPNEYVDAAVGIRRLGEMPAFAVLDIIRASKSDDPQSFQKALNTPLGQYFSSFFTPLNTPKEFAVGISEAAGDTTPLTKSISDTVSPWKSLRDVQGQELTGPTRQILAPSTLPKRYDPFVGRPMNVEHPILRQTTGIALKDMTKFETLMTQFPEISMASLLGEQGNVFANNAVAKYMGQILQSKTSSGDSIGDQLYEAVNNLNVDYPAKKQVIKEIVRSIRTTAIGMAEAENPAAFLEKHLSSIFPSERAPEKRKAARELRKMFGGLKD